MFIENYTVNSMIDQILKKFPHASLSGSDVTLFTGIEEEYNSLKYGAGIRLSLEKSVVKLTGKDTLDFLHRVSTNDVKDLKPFYKHPTLFLNEKGRFIDRTVLLNLDSHFILIGENDSGRLNNWLTKYIIMEEIQTADLSKQNVIFDLIGPQSESYLTLILGDEIKSLNGENILNPSVDGFNFFLFSMHEPNGLKYYRILISSDQAPNFFDYLLENKSVFDVTPVGSSAYDIFRVESGIPAYPNEINDQFNPHENSLISEVNFKKGCYIGQEVIARLDTYDKVSRVMTGFVFDQPFESSLPASIFDVSGEEIGLVTSVVGSIQIGKKIGLGFLKKKFIGSDNEIYLKAGSQKINLSVSGIPFKK